MGGGLCSLGIYIWIKIKRQSLVKRGVPEIRMNEIGKIKEDPPELSTESVVLMKPTDFELIPKTISVIADIHREL